VAGGTPPPGGGTDLEKKPVPAPPLCRVGCGSGATPSAILPQPPPADRGRGGGGMADGPSGMSVENSPWIRLASSHPIAKYIFYPVCLRTVIPRSDPSICGMRRERFWAKLLTNDPSFKRNNCPSLEQRINVSGVWMPATKHSQTPDGLHTPPSPRKVVT